MLPPCDPRADVGILYIEASGHLPMCGHDTIGVVTALIQHGHVPSTEPTTRLVLDTPAGLVETTAAVEDGHVTSVTFTSTPSFLYAQDVALEIPDFGHDHCRHRVERELLRHRRRHVSRSRPS